MFPTPVGAIHESPEQPKSQHKQKNGGSKPPPYPRRGGVRVSGGDLCIRKYAEAPTEPAGETFRARPSTVDFGANPMVKRNP